MADLAIEDKEDFNEGLIRVIQELTKEALSSVKNPDDKDRHEAVHEARKAFKKARAAFRLVRDHTGRSFYKKQNNFYRDLGRELSDIRDAHSDIETLDLLSEQFEDVLPDDAFPNIYEALYDKRKSQVEKVLDDQNTLEKIAIALKEKLKESETWRFEVGSFEDIRQSIKRVYKRGHKGYRKSLESRKTEDIHDWRKRVKYMRYQLENISRIWPQVLLVMEDELHDVSDFTGMYHDCVELMQSVEELDIQDFQEVELLRSLAGRHEKNMMDLAFYTANKFYWEKPGQFVDRIEGYWDAHEKYVIREGLIGKEKLEY